MKRLINLLILIFVILAGSIMPAFAINYDNYLINPVITYDNYLYVADATAPIPVIEIYNTVSSITTPVATISGQGEPAGMVLSPDGTKLYVAYSDSVKMFDSKSGARLATATGNYYGNKQIAVSSDNKHLFVVDSSADNVKVINIRSDGRLLYAGSYPIRGAASLYGIAVSPDNSLLAVSRRNASDSVYIYNISYEASGDVSELILKKELPSLPYPGHVLFSNDSEYLYVRVDDAATFVDAKVYKVSDNFATPKDIVLVNRNEQDSGNLHGESMALSSNGEVLYLTHYVSSSTIESENNKIHAYSMRTKVKEINASGEAVWVPRSNWTFGFASNGQTYDSEFKKNLGASKDGMAAAPDGSRIWFSCSNGGGFTFSKYTGFTNSSGDLINPVPQSPTIVHPSAGSGDDLLNYSGIAQWSGQAGSKFDVYYKEVGANSWKLLEGYTSNTYASLAGKLIPGHIYVIRAKAFVSSVWSSYAYSQQFKMANPKITGIENQRNAAIDSAAIFQFIRIKGRGFGDKDVFDANFDEQINFRSADGTDNIIPIKEGDDRRITAWADDHIDMVIPLKFGVSVGPNGKERDRKVVPGDYKIIVTAYGIDTPAFAFGVDPVINNMTPVEEVPGKPIDIYGQGFGTNTSEVWIALGGEKTKPEKVEEDHIVFKVPSGLSTNTPLPLKVFANNRFTPSVYGRGNWDQDVLFTALTPQTPAISTIEVKDDNLTISYTPQIWGYVYSTVKLTGDHFGAPAAGVLPGKIKIQGMEIPTANIYSWTNSTIEVGIPQKIGTTYIDPGLTNITIETNGLAANTQFTVKPKIYSDLRPIDPSSGYVSQPITIFGFGLGDKGAPVTVDFISSTDAVTSVATIGADRGDIDKVVVNVPSSLVLGTYEVKIEQNGQESNKNYTYTVIPTPIPTITSIEVKDDDAAHGGFPLTPQNWGYVYSTIRITGTNLVDSQGTPVIKIGNVTVPSANIYPGGATQIDIVIPRKDSSNNFVNAGTDNNTIDITINGIHLTQAFTVKPRVYSTSPTSGISGTNVSVDVSGTALGGGTTSINIGNSSGTVGDINRNGDSDVVATVFTLGSDTGLQPVSATVNGQASNTGVQFNVIPAGTPNPLVVQPNVAPTGTSIEAVITGSGFLSNTTVKLSLQGYPDITGTVDTASISSNSMKVKFVLKNADNSNVQVGDYDVVVANGAASKTLTKGFKVMPADSAISQVIDDYEGAIVAFPGGYTFNGGPSTLGISTAIKYEGLQAAQISYETTNLGYRMFTGQMSAMVDSTNFTSISVRVKGVAGMVGKAKLQFVDGKGDNYKSSASNWIPLDGTGGTPDLNGFIEFNIPLSEFKQRDDNGNETGGLARDKWIQNYQIVFTDNSGTPADSYIYVDYVALSGYTPPVVTTGAPQNLKAAKSTNDVVLTWEAPQGGASSYNIYEGQTSTSLTLLLNVATAYYTHQGASGDKDHYYVVKAVNSLGTESGASNMAFSLKRTLTLNQNAISNMFWISLPYNNNYQKARDIVNEINGIMNAGDPGTCSEIGKFITETGVTERLTYYGGGVWYDEQTNDDQGFSISTGEAYYISVNGTTTWLPAGSDNTDFKFSLTPIGTNMYWVSLPYNADYSNARSIVDHINQGIEDQNNFIVQEIGKFDPNSGNTERLTYYGGGVWYDDQANNDQGFNFEPGEGYYISIFQPLSNWAPRRKS